MRVSKEKLEKARKLRLEGKSMREAAKLVGISRMTLRKYERGWIDGKGEIHGGWVSDKLKNAREAKQLVSEVRELSKAIAQDQASAGEELPPGVKQVVTLEDMKAHYERTRDITPSYIEPPEDPDAVPEAPPEAGDGRAVGKRASVDEEIEPEEDDEPEGDEEDCE
jgi:transposase